MPCWLGDLTVQEFTIHSAAAALSWSPTSLQSKPAHVLCIFKQLCNAALVPVAIGLQLAQHVLRVTDVVCTPTASPTLFSSVRSWAPRQHLEFQTQYPNVFVQILALPGSKGSLSIVCTSAETQLFLTSLLAPTGARSLASMSSISAILALIVLPVATSLKHRSRVSRGGGWHSRLSCGHIHIVRPCKCTCCALVSMPMQQLTLQVHSIGTQLLHSIAAFINWPDNPLAMAIPCCRPKV